MKKLYIVRAEDNGPMFHLHAANCRDLRRYRQPLDGWDFTPEDDGDSLAYQASRDIYCDHVTDYGWTEDTHPAECRQYWTDVSHDVKVFPCCK